MEIMALLTQIFELCVIPLLAILAKFVIDYLRSKSEELQIKAENELEAKYIERITETVVTCILATNQTYVDSLKQQGNFDQEAQKKAFEQTYEAIVALLDEEIQDYIIEICGDLEVYLKQQIEAQIKAMK